MKSFQILTWDSSDVNTDDTTDFRVTMYGRTDEGNSIAAHCYYKPCFFVEIPQHWRDGSYIQNELNEHKSFNKYANCIHDIRIVKKKKFFGFTNNQWFRFVRVIFTSKEAWKQAHYILRNKYSVYEANIEPVLRFIHVCKIQTTGWVNVDDGKYTNVEDRETTCEEEILISKFQNILHNNDKQSICKLKMCSFDIEVYSSNGSFPDALSTDNDCPIIQIASTYKKYGDDKPYHYDLFTLKKCNTILNVNIVECENERDLLLKWCESIVNRDPDIMIGYNIWKFDLSYIFDRASRLRINFMLNLNRTKDITSTQYSAKFSSSAYGDNEYKMVTSTGRMQIDLLELYKREHKLIKYSLSFVSEHFLKDDKIDMPIKELFSRYENGNPDDMYEIGKYCVKDTELPLQLMHKLNDIPNLMEMAKATYVPMNYLIERGQQIKVFSQITRQTQIEDMVVITPKSSVKSDSFVGATVLKADKGAYMEEVVTGLDFASLYPTIMRAHNLCYNTIVLDENRYGNIDGVEYEETTWEVDGTKYTYKFAQNTQGILPKLLETLAKNRKQAKKDMAKAVEGNDVFMKNVFNGKQLAFKVSMNSIYGFCAAFMLPCQPISATVTTIGRNMIEKTKNLVEEWYPGARVIYGDTDSVMVIFETTSDDILKESFKLGNEAADKISATFKYPIELEFEKCYYPYLLFSKKRYAGLMYTNPEKPDYIDAKGIQLVRRDNPNFVKQVSKKVLDMIMYDRQIYESQLYAKEQGQLLLDGEVPIDDLIVSKSMRKDYKNTNQPHLYVATKIEKRQPGSGPKSGDRVPYVFIKTNNAKDLQYKKAEDPNYVKENKDVELDYIYYLEHSLMSPLSSLFELFTADPGEELFGDMRREYLKTKEKNARQIASASFFKPGNIAIANSLPTIKPKRSKKVEMNIKPINMFFP